MKFGNNSGKFFCFVLFSILYVSPWPVQSLMFFSQEHCRRPGQRLPSILSSTEGNVTSYKMTKTGFFHFFIMPSSSRSLFTRWTTSKFESQLSNTATAYSLCFTFSVRVKKCGMYVAFDEVMSYVDVQTYGVEFSLIIPNIAISISHSFIYSYSFKIEVYAGKQSRKAI